MPDNLLPDIKNKFYTQDYSPKPIIEGIIVKDLKNYPGEDGDFSELFRLKNGKPELFPDFEIKQINRSKVFPGGVKAWHFHFLQDEIWYISPHDNLLLGLWDLRNDSQTKKQTMRLTLGGSSSRMVYIPRGVAHGCVNLSKNPSEIYYFLNNNFNPEKPDEQRMPWNTLGADFWQPQKD